MYALNAANGAKLWSSSLGYSYLGNPSVSDGVLYLNAYTGNTYALGLLGGVDSKLLTTAPSISSLHPDFTLEVTR